MIDLETVDTKITAGIVSIAAVEFDLKRGKTGHHYYAGVGLDNAKLSGTYSKSTLSWWKGLGEEVNKQLKPRDPIPLHDALIGLSDFIQNTIGIDQVNVWGNGSVFDIGILNYHYGRLGIVEPWKFWNIKDVRTLCNLGNIHKRDIEFVGDEHNPTDDCLHQIRMCYEAYWRVNR